MRECPIIFSAPMIRAILAGRKTQTRRLLRRQPVRLGECYDRVAGWLWPPGTEPGEDGCKWPIDGDPSDILAPWCLYGRVGDHLWVRETISIVRRRGGDWIYRADLPEDIEKQFAWRPSIHMPRWASRILLEITEVRVQRVQEISEADAIAEGVDGPAALICSQCCGWRGSEHDKLMEWEDDGDWGYLCPVCTERLSHHAIDEQSRQAFRDVWNSLNAKRGFGWGTNPWVWVITFKRIRNG